MDDESLEGGYEISSWPVNDDGQLCVGIMIGPVEFQLSFADAIRVRDTLQRTLSDRDGLQATQEDTKNFPPPPPSSDPL